jgi:hypothetical protein
MPDPIFPMMIFRLTAKLAKKIGLDPLPVLPCDKDKDPLLDWNAHLFTVQRTQYILVTNTKSLYSLVVPGRGITTDRQFVQSVRTGLQAFVAGQGHHLRAAKDLLSQDRETFFSRITNRRILGSMNDFIFQSKIRLEEGQQTPFEVSFYLNETPMSYLKYRSPKKVFQQLLLQVGEPTGQAHEADNVIYLSKVRPTDPNG